MIGVCEGRFFERLGDAMGAAQKVVLEQTPCAVGGAAVLHNVIIGQRNTIFQIMTTFVAL